MNLRVRVYATGKGGKQRRLQLLSTRWSPETQRLVHYALTHKGYGLIIDVGDTKSSSLYKFQENSVLINGSKVLLTNKLEIQKWLYINGFLAGIRPHPAVRRT